MPDRFPGLPRLLDFLVLLALVAIVFLPGALEARDLNFDDPFFFGPAAFPGGFAQVWDPTRTIANAYLPVSHTSLWLDAQWFGPDSAGPRIHALLLHTLAAFVLARIFVRLGVGRVAALAGAGVFAVHPALVESVAWVSSRKDVLSGLFVFLCIGAAIRSSTSPDGRPAEARQPLWAVAWAVLALYSKGTAVVLPLLLAPVLLLWSRPRRVGLFAILTVVTILAGVHHSLVAVGEGTLVAHSDFATRLAQMPGAFSHYVTTAFWPTGLNVLYPEVATLESFRAEILPALAVALAFSAAIVVALRRDKPLVAVGLAVFALALSPFNTALPASSIAAADRYLYLAIPGAALAILGLGPRLGPVLAAVAIVPSLMLSTERVRDFQGDRELWSASLREDPDNAVALFNLADVLWPNPETLPEAQALLRKAQTVARYPEHELRASSLLMALAAATGRSDRSIEYAEQTVAALDRLPAGKASRALTRDLLLDAARQARIAERPDLADAWLERARSVDPDDPDVLSFCASARLGQIVDEQGRVDPEASGVPEVESLLEHALQSPRGSTIYGVPLAQAELAAALGRTMAAQKHYRRAIELAPARAEAHIGRAQVYLSRGIYKGAENAVRDAFALGVRDPRLQYLLGLALGGQGELDRARDHYESYLVGRPHDPAARRSLAAVIAGQALRDLQQLEPERLERLADRIRELDPDNPKGFVVRAFAMRHVRDLQGALLMFERARAALPGDAEIDRYYVESLRDRGYQCLLEEEGRDGAAYDYFRQFLDADPRRHGIEVESVTNLLRAEWERTLDAARTAMLDDRLEVAQQGLDRCLELLPDNVSPRYFSGLIRFQRGDELTEALEDFRAFVEYRRAQEADATVAVFYEVMTLQRLDRDSEALARADAYLKAVDSAPEGTVEASAADLDRLRAARDAAAQRSGR